MRWHARVDFQLFSQKSSGIPVINVYAVFLRTFVLHGCLDVQDPAYNTGKFGEIKELIIGMLENYNYEEVCLLCYIWAC